ncbi:unnamed protein product [Cunninghamella blakesleeana]
MSFYSKVVVLFSVIIYTVVGAGTDDIFEVQPEIHHQFRPSERMPSPSFSKLFALLTLSPWLLLLVGWLSVGTTPKAIVSGLTSQRGIWILSFVSSLLVTEYIFYLYWTRWNIFETMTYVAVWSLVLFVTGQRALTSIQLYRLSNNKK